MSNSYESFQKAAEVVRVGPSTRCRFCHSNGQRPLFGLRDDASPKSSSFSSVRKTRAFFRGRTWNLLNFCDQTSVLPETRPEGAGYAVGPSPQAGTTERTDLRPAPLRPSWIIQGDPTARSLPLGESADGHFSFGLWDCTAGQFKFLHRSDEFVHILEGGVTVNSAGKELHLGPGDVAFFPKGLTTYWNVHDYVKKLAVFRSVHRGLLSRVKEKLRRAWRSISRS